jgi:hypothetical protein
MKKTFFSKSVAFIFLFTVLCNFSVFHFVNAAAGTLGTCTLNTHTVTTQAGGLPTPVTCTTNMGQRWVYEPTAVVDSAGNQCGGQGGDQSGTHTWWPSPMTGYCGSFTGNSDGDMQTAYGMTDFSAASAYDTAYAAYAAAKGVTMPTLAATSTTSWWDNLKEAPGNYALGVVTQPVFLALQTILFVIGLLLALILGVIGMVFDAAIKMSVNDLGTVINGLNGIWIFFRDIVNVSFIFILLYIAIKKIIGASGLDEKKAIGNVVINAIFVNFSLFIAKFLIDIGNLLTVIFYNQISMGGGTSISGMIFNNLHIADLFTLSIFSSGTTQINIIVLLLAKIAIVGTVIYVFFWGIFIFLGRAVMLIYLAAISPIAYFGNTIPKLKTIGDDWWKDFIDQIMVAPVFMIFMIIISRVLQISTLANPTSAATALGAVSGSNQGLNITAYFMFILVTMLLLKALKETKELSGKVAGMAMKVAGGVAAVGAIAATGGVAAYSTAGQMLFSKDAAKASEGKTGLDKWSARLSFATDSKNNRAMKFLAGGHEEESGYLAKGLSGVRKNINTGLKAATAVDLVGIQKNLEKAQKENEKRKGEEEAKLGPKPIEDAAAAAAQQKASIESEARAVHAEDLKKAAQESATEKAAIEKEHNQNTAAKEAADKAAEQADKVADNAQRNGNAKQFKQAQASQAAARQAQASAQAAFGTSAQKLTEFNKKFGEKETEIMGKTMNDMAKKMGTSMEKINSTIENKKANLAKNRIEVQKRANDLESAGFLGGIIKHGLFATGATQKKRTEMAYKMRAGKMGKETSAQARARADKLQKEEDKAAGIVSDEEKPAAPKVTPPEAH